MIQTVPSLIQISAALTRPANTTAYTAGDVIDAGTAAGLTFANAARSKGGGGRIRDGMLFDSANVATPPDVQLWLFSAALAAYDADNAAFTPVDSDFHDVQEGITDGIVGVIQFATGNAFVGDATAGAGGNLIIPASKTFLPLDFVCATDNTSLFGVLVVRNAYAPVSSEQFRVFLRIEQA